MRTTTTRGRWLLAVAGIGLLLAACGSGGGSPALPGQQGGATTSGGQEGTACPPGGSAKSLTGAGSTFAFPLYSKWFDVYGRQCGVQVNYQSVGSGAGIKQITDHTVDFGATDAFLNEEQLTAAPGITHIATASGSVAVIYNLPGIESGKLRLSGDVLADIYLGNITHWNDQRIASLNPDLKLPDTAIAVIHRAEGRGTTFIFTNYLSKVSSQWKDQVGSSTSVNWPAGLGGQGSEGVSGQVRQVQGAIGYVELAYATQTRTPWAAMRNQAGNFVEPGLDATTAAAQGVQLPRDLRATITDSSNPQAYPIAGFTWVLVYQDQQDCAKAQSLASVLWWGVHDGQQYTKDLLYAPLAPDVVKLDEQHIQSMTCGGKPVLSATPGG